MSYRDRYPTPDDPDGTFEYPGMLECPAHPNGMCIPDIETLEYDSDDDLYLQRCTLTGQTWWARNDDETWK